jgi:hypothetical protein
MRTRPRRPGVLVRGPARRRPAGAREIYYPQVRDGEDSVTITRATAVRYHLTSMQGETN